MKSEPIDDRGAEVFGEGGGGGINTVFGESFHKLKFDALLIFLHQARTLKKKKKKKKKNRDDC